MQIAILSKNNKNNILNFLVPMFGDSSFTGTELTINEVDLFSSPCWGILFSQQ